MNSITVLFVVAAASATAIPALPVLSQYHAQDELGQYSYGYSGGPSSKQELRTIDGITRGAFSYVDSNGLIQSRSYVSDAVNGFRVAASDVPMGHPEAVVAPVVSTYSAAAPPVVSTYSAAASPVVSTYTAAASPVVSTYSAAASPVVSTYAAAVPAVIPATSTVVAAGTHTQYHSQDALGQYRYGYSGGSSAKDEVKTADGVTRGAFSYIDSHGLVQTRSYVADDFNGFRVAASDLPVAPAPVVAAAPVPAVAPVSVAPVAPVSSVPVAPVDLSVSVPELQPVGIPVASAPVAPSPVAPAPVAPAPVVSAPASPAEAPASDLSSDSVVVDAA